MQNLPIKTALKFAAAVLLLYICTLAPDLVWQDQGDYQYQSAMMNLIRPGDAVRVHPLYITISHIIGVITPSNNWAYAANLTSAIFAAAVAFNLFLIIAALGGSIFSAFLGAGVYSLAHTPWFTGVQAQSYSLAMALFTGGLLAALLYAKEPKKHLLAIIGLLFGLGFSTHLMSQIGFAVIMAWLFIRLCCRELKVKEFALVCACWFIGGALNWLVAAIEYTHAGSIGAVATSLIWGKWSSQVLNLDKSVFLLKRSVAFFVLNFPTPLVAFSLAGIYFAPKRLKSPEKWLLAVITLLYALFAVRYDVRNQNHFFLPFYAMVSVYLGLGYHYIFAGKNSRHIFVCLIMLLAIPEMYPIMAYLAETNQVELGTNRHIPYRNVYSYYLVPWQQDQDGPRQMATEILNMLPDNAILYADTTVSPPLEYMLNIENKRNDITLLSSYETLPPQIEQEQRLFTVCDSEGYRPKWIKQEQLKKFHISEKEYIFEIIYPSN